MLIAIPLLWLALLLRPALSDFRNVPFEAQRCGLEVPDDPDPCNKKGTPGYAAPLYSPGPSDQVPFDRRHPAPYILAASAEFRDASIQHYSRFLLNENSRELIVGARDALFRLQLNDLKLLEKAFWPAPDDKVELCSDKGQSADDCHNFINVLLSHGKRLFTCGTNAFSPLCTWREMDNVNSVLDQMSGVARAPYSPRANMTALLTEPGIYYIAAPTDFSGTDPAITRNSIDSSSATPAIRTNQFNSKWLNEAQFVGSFEEDKFVYFMFREPAVEYINCGKIVYARIARVCKQDAGGTHLLKNNWTTFLKARLNCSLPGDYPFYFDEIQGMTYRPEDRTIYATFTTPRNSIPGSAICMFNMSAVETAFAGDFKAQRHTGAAWERDTSNHRVHFQCNFSSSHPRQYLESERFQLMDQAVQPATAKPLYTAELETLTHIAVEVISTKLHTQVRIMYVATADGKVKKISILPRTQQSCVVGVWSADGPVLSLQVLPKEPVVLLGLQERVLRVPTSLCGRHKSRAACARAQDPHCGWNELLLQCTPPPDGNPLSAHWQQSVIECPVLSGPVDGGWSSWSSWFTCSHLGDGAVAAEDTTDKCKCRTRQCTNPAPQNGGAPCTGVSIAVTNCTVHGGWTAYSSWSQCSQTCGIAIKTRYRTCGNPAPAHGGRVCVGPDRSEIYCTTNPPCPQMVPPPRDGGWSDWGPWTECSAPCGGGFRMRSRKCDNPAPADAGQDCPGCPLEYETCNIEQCNESKRLSAWTSWMTVSNTTTKSGFTEKRLKFSCKAAVVDPSSIKLSVAKEEERFCYSDGSCTKNARVENEGTWSQWSSWSECSKECGGGTQEATRVCLGGEDCEGPSKTTRPCNTHRCRGEWSCWTDWSPCAVSCGLGVQARTRECRHPGTLDTAGAGCEGSPMQQRPCEMPSCHSLQGWGEWSEWSLCDSNNEQHRRRHCLTSNPGPQLCQGRNIQARMCIEGQNQDDVSNDIPTLASASIIDPRGGSEVGLVLGCSLAAFIFGSVIALAATYYYQKHRRVRVPGSPHYISKPNAYVTVPLREPPKRSSSSASSNGSSGYKSSSATSPTKLFSKPPDYETATIKRNSGLNGHGVRAQLDEDKFF